MSLVRMAQHVQGPRTLGRNVLVVLAVSIAVIVGLLAMHSLNTHAVSAEPAAETAAQANAEMTAHHSPAVPSEPEVGCAACGQGEHSSAWMACVIGLLLTLLLLAPRRGPGAAVRTARGDRVPRLLWAARCLAAPPGPSLNVLCISRT
jgi:energy-converting hydrogenase Eha subunit F